MTMNDVVKIARVLNHSHGRCVVGAFDKILHEESIWTVPKTVVYFILHKSIFLHLLHHGTKFYDKYIKYDDRNKYTDNGWSGIFPKQKVIKLYNAIISK